ncbi:Hypothetical protein CAP_1357 [Chondromyces apiculatus DSM 436]|uniref:Uncharacterized protein n=1 Tax=Chondromyces apiculatus DSM 436 TaxID=1192034 RepID=A0A017SV01_9BACT|nr:Hypothetical protein CAP_1357 [Chondromyces apiculatus DSM 436]
MQRRSAHAGLAPRDPAASLAVAGAGASRGRVPTVAVAAPACAARSAAPAAARAGAGVLDQAATCDAHPARAGRPLVRVGRALSREREAAQHLAHVPRRRAHHRLGPHAHPALAHVDGGAGLPIVAGRAIGPRRIGAGAGVPDPVAVRVLLPRVRRARAVVRGVEHPVAVVVGIAHVAQPVAVEIGLARVVDRRAVVDGVLHPVAVCVGDGAHPVLARPSAGAGRPVRPHRLRAGSRGRIARPLLVARVGWRAHHRRPSGAAPSEAAIAHRAGVLIVARRPVGFLHRRAHAAGHVAGPLLVAGVGRRAHHRVLAGAHPARAGVGVGASIAIAAGAAVRCGRVGAHPRRRIAGPGQPARPRLRRRAGHHRATAARAALAGVVCRAGVGVVARRPVGPHRRRADPGRRVARPRRVAGADGRARLRRPAHAHPAVAHVAVGAGVAIVAGVVVGRPLAEHRHAGVGRAGVPVVTLGVRLTGARGPDPRVGVDGVSARGICRPRRQIVVAVGDHRDRLAERVDPHEGRVSGRLPAHLPDQRPVRPPGRQELLAIGAGGEADLGHLGGEPRHVSARCSLADVRTPARGVREEGGIEGVRRARGAPLGHAVLQDPAEITLLPDEVLRRVHIGGHVPRRRPLVEVAAPDGAHDLVLVRQRLDGPHAGDRPCLRRTCRGEHRQRQGQQEASRHSSHRANLP